MIQSATFRIIACLVCVFLTCPLTALPEPPNIIKKHLHLDRIETYDEIIQLLDAIESGELERKCTLAELNELSHFLGHLAGEGKLPGASDPNLEEEICALIDPPWQEQIVLCGGVGHSWKKVKRFVKKHKKEIIVGAIIIVAVTAVVVTACCVGGTVAASEAVGGGAAVASTLTDKQKNDANVSEFKKTLTEENLLLSDLPVEETGRIAGSLFAQKLLTDLKSDTPIEQFREALDSIFRTHHSEHFINKAPDFVPLAYRLRGERAMQENRFLQAESDFTILIDKTPDDPLPHLDRGIARFAQGNYASAEDDYNAFTKKQGPINSALKLTESFREGLRQGGYHSLKSSAALVRDLITHPVRTATQTWDGLCLLKDLAKTNEWHAISQALAPEVTRLIAGWDSLPPRKRAYQSGYVIGKYGADIVTAGAAAKLASQGVKGAKQLATASQKLRNANKLVLLEATASAPKPQLTTHIAKTKQTLQQCEKAGLSAKEVKQLTKAGKLEQTLAKSNRTIDSNPVLKGSYEKFKSAEKFLSQYKGYFPEERCRELIHKTGIPTFPRPKGIPKNYRVRVSNTGAGMTYLHPKNNHTSIRVMPGKPHSIFPHQRKPYVIHKINGKTVDKYGNRVRSVTEEAHIPLDEFKYRN